MQRLNPLFQRSRLHTNGVGLFRTLPCQSVALLDALVRCGLTGISVSLAHFDPNTNRALMQLRGWPGLKGEDVREIVTRAPKLSLRLSCCLHQDGVWTADDALSYVTWGTALGSLGVADRPITHLSRTQTRRSGPVCRYSAYRAGPNFHEAGLR